MGVRDQFRLRPRPLGVEGVVRMNWLYRTFGRAFVWRLGSIAAVSVVGAVAAYFK